KSARKGGLADWYSVSVSKCRLDHPLGGPPPASGWRSARGGRWRHRPSSVASGIAWTKLQGKSTTYSVTLVKHIIGGPESPASTQVKLVEVDEESAGQRLENFPFPQPKGLPNTTVYRIIRSGEVRVNKGRAAADTRVAAGDKVRL